MNKILILTEKENDFSTLILKNCPNSQCSMLDDENIKFEDFDSVCILGGTEENPVTLPASKRIKIEEMILTGKPVFCEFVSSIGSVYSGEPTKTSHHRLVYSNEYTSFADLKNGDILDGHYNDVVPYYFIPETAVPILTYHDYLCAHDNIKTDTETFRSGKWALWKMNEKTLVCSFRICNFNRARLAPRDNWIKIIENIVFFLCGEKINLLFQEPIYTLQKNNLQKNEDAVNKSVKDGLNWFYNAGMLKNNGKSGVYEGFSHHIDAKNGTQQLRTGIRADCTGETGGAFLLDYLINQTPESYEIFKNTEAFCFDFMQIKNGRHKGMIRWTESAWEVCYQDDVARAIIPTLICENFGGGSAYFCEAQDALNYLIETTGEDGLRVSRTECCELTPARISELKQAGKGTPCAHYNAYYHAALLLASRTGAGAHFADVAVKGLTSIMKLYPNTSRETSETEEMCRLVFPLALLYEHTGEKEHYNWLCRVVRELDRVQHSSGGYAEWDTGYTAACSRNNNGECALLAHNGDPVADLLYSNNWLPLGFAYAYMVTKEEYFYEKWKKHADFLTGCQLHSDNPLLNGTWSRAVDMNRMEIYGVPHDTGWAPCCIETGWTVAEILTGLQFMTIAKKHISEQESMR